MKKIVLLSVICFWSSASFAKLSCYDLAELVTGAAWHHEQAHLEREPAAAPQLIEGPVGLG